ncbi:MAG: bifunctional oligoribonuclease/PAP phosphatase NrnA [Proteobacteria bacterium]|nr:bifunctional oligoribonuclease/PAP phosphatase NrnA [Pseudomonadota bacterium]
MGHNFQEIIATINKASKVLITTHIFPDGDALGSQLALGNILESIGKEVFLYGEEEVNYMYDFLPGGEKIKTELPDLDSVDCIVALDCGDQYRLGKAMDRLLAHPMVIMIDHHAGNKEFGNLTWVEPKRAATGEMVFDLATALDAELSSEAAYCLYTAIVSDTGSFKYNSTTADTFRIARELIFKGISPAEVAGNLFDNFTEARLHLMKEVLATLALYDENRIAVIHVTREMFEKTGAGREDTETFINYPRSLGTVKVAVFVKEAENGEISVSLRSKGNGCDVAAVASKFGGGGHRNAAGFRILNQSVDAVRDQVLDEITPAIIV